MDKQLKEYITKSRKAGQTDLQIMNDLAAAGWPEEQILDALRPDLSGKKKILPKKIIISVCGVIVIAALLIITVKLIITSDNQSKTSSNSEAVTPQKNNNKHNQQSAPDNQSTGSANADTIGKFIAYEKKIEDNAVHRQIVFHNYETGKNLPEHKELKEDKYWSINVGQWSPNGRYLPIFKYIPDTFYKDIPSDASHVLYLFDSATGKLNKLVELPIDYEKRQKIPSISELRTDPTSSVMRWLDEDKIVLRSYRQSETEYYLNYITLKGEVKYEKNDNPFWEEESIGNDTLYYELSTYESNNASTTQGDNIAYKNIYFKGNKTNLLLDDQPIGVIDDTLITMHLPVINLYAITEQQQAEMKLKYEAGATDADLLREYTKYYVSDEKAYLNYINPFSSENITTVGLNETGWHTRNVVFNDARKNFILFQTDYLLAPDRYRILSFNPSTNDKQIIFEGTSDKIGQTMYAFGAMQESFAVTFNGDYLIAYINSDESLGVVNINLDTLELKKICSSECYGVKIPNHKRMRSYFDKI